MTNNEKKILEYLEMMPAEIQADYVAQAVTIIEILKAEGIISVDNLEPDRSTYLH